MLSQSRDVMSKQFSRVKTIRCRKRQRFCNNTRFIFCEELGHYCFEPGPAHDHTEFLCRKTGVVSYENESSSMHSDSLVLCVSSFMQWPCSPSDSNE